MTVSVCPVATIGAPPGLIWRVLTDTDSYGALWDARLDRVDPPGPAQAGQIVHLTSRAIGRDWPVTITVLGVDPARHVLELSTALPLGIGVRNHIVVAPLSPTAGRVSFG